LTEEQGKSVHNLYSDHVQGRGRPLAERLWGRIPADMSQAYALIKEVRGRYGATPADIEGLKRAMKAQLRRLGVLTGSVEESIDRLENGVVEAGQQPMCLGGPSLILNKIAYARSLCDLGGDGFVPLFYNADYDGVQAELLNMRLPSPSPRGLLISYPAGPEYEGSPIRLLPNPPEEWLEKTLEKIVGNYRGLLRGRDERVQERALQNLDHALTVLKGAYYSTENVSDWSAKTLGHLLNVESNLGVPVISPSDPGMRGFFQQGYEQLLSEPNRSQFIEASNGAVELIEAAGYRSQIGRRGDDYVPFFLECTNTECNRTRIELKYSKEGSTNSIARGKCPRCGEVHEISFKARSPDLSDWIDWISPRVDSRQVIVDSAFPVLAHVGGPGETSYYAEVIPGVRPLDIPFPVYLRYTRAFYNTPWNEGRAEALRERGFMTLMREELFSALTSWVEARNEGNSERLKGAHRLIREVIQGTYEGLLERTESLQAEIDGIKGRLRNPADRASLIGEMRERQTLVHELENYLSSAFGRFSVERFGQEVSWAWLDLAIVSGLGDLLGAYLRQYNEQTPNSSVYFINL